MFKGTYNRRTTIDLRGYCRVNFKFNRRWMCRGYGCGANALSVITGAYPYDIMMANRGDRHYSDTFMKKYLKGLGYKLIPVTMCRVSLRGVNMINKNHVLLVSQLYKYNEASWTVIHKNKVCHNFDVFPLNPMELFNRPTLSVYVVWRDEWDDDPSWL